MIIAAHQTMLAPQSAPLPYDAEVEYVESTGSQFVDTGMIMDSSSVFEGDIAVTASGTQFVFGLYQTTNPTSNFAVAAALSGKWIFDRKNTYNRISSSVGVSVGTRTTIVAGNDAISVNGVSTSSSAVAFSASSATSYLFAWNRPSDSPQVGYGRVRVYSCRIAASNGSRNFIPVRVGTSGYLYDSVSAALFGSGDFIAGPDKT